MFTFIFNYMQIHTNDHSVYPLVPVYGFACMSTQHVCGNMHTFKFQLVGSYGFVCLYMLVCVDMCVYPLCTISMQISIVVCSCVFLVCACA